MFFVNFHRTFSTRSPVSWSKPELLRFITSIRHLLGQQPAATENALDALKSVRNPWHRIADHMQTRDSRSCRLMFHRLCRLPVFNRVLTTPRLSFSPDGLLRREYLDLLYAGETHLRWTPEEDQVLRSVYRPDMQWDAVAEAFNRLVAKDRCRSSLQLNARWRRVHAQKPERRAVHWKKEEVDKLRVVMKMYADGREVCWREVAEQMPGRSTDACRYMWRKVCRERVDVNRDFEIQDYTTES